MAHMVEKMMYVGETPWHGLGVKLSAPPSIADAIAQGGLDWTVSLEQLQLKDGCPVDRWAVVRSSDRGVLGTVGSGFHPVQNAEAFEFFQPYLDAKQATIETAGSLRSGARVFMLAKINRPDSVIVKESDDRVSKYLLIAQGHDGSLSLTTALTPIRVVCQNTLSVAIGEGSTKAAIKIRHTTNGKDALKAVQEIIDRVDADFEKAAEVFRALSHVKVTERELRRFVDRVFRLKGKRAENLEQSAAVAQAAVEPAKDDSMAALLSRPVAILNKSGEDEEERSSRVADKVVELFEGGRGNNLPGVKGTGWAAYNAATEYLSWERGRSNDARMNTLWFGGNNRAQVALEVAQQEFLAR